MKQKLEKRSIILIIVLHFIQIQNQNLSEFVLIDYPKLMNFRLFILQFNKKETKII